MNKGTKFLPSEFTYISQFNDNLSCVRAVQLAVTHLDTLDENNISLLRRLVYVASVAAQSTDDEVFICSMLHPLGEYKYTDLPVILTGLGYETLKVVQALRETEDVESLYNRVLNLDDKYKAIVMARVMYRLLNIELCNYEDAESIIDEANTYTKKLDVPLEIKVQFEMILQHATRVFTEVYSVEILTDELEDELSDSDIYVLQSVEHKRVADELGISHGESVTLPQYGEITYHNGVGFCDKNGEVIDLSSTAPEDSASSGTVSIHSSDYDYEVKLHLAVAKSLGVVFDKQVTNLGDFGRVTYSQGIGFFNSDAQMVALKGSVFDMIQNKYKDPEEVVEAPKSAEENPVDKHHKLAITMKVQHGYCTNIINVGKVTYDSTRGFLKEDGTTIDLSEMII